jgi:hypothetical protein
MSAPEPSFTVLSVAARRNAAVPTLDFDVHVAETSGHEVYTMALTVAITIEPARRAYAGDAHARLEGLFGAPERWAVTTRSLAWAQAAVLVPAFTGATTFKVAIPCSYDLEQSCAAYFSALAEGEVPLAFHFNGTILYRGDADSLQMVLVPWSCTVDFSLPVAVWRGMMDAHFPNGGWVALHAETIAALRAEQLRRAAPTLDACLAELLGETCSSD